MAEHLAISSKAIFGWGSRGREHLCRDWTLFSGRPVGWAAYPYPPKRVGATPAPSGSYVIEASLGLLEAAKLSLPRHWRGRCRHILSSKIPSKLPFKVHEKG
jgi:hypothetical protein